MYRLPNQFDPVARNGSVSAAGGGSTSTTCSCCIVTLLATCITPAVLFTRQPSTLPGLNGIDGIDDVVRGAEPTIAPIDASASVRNESAQPTHHLDLTAPPAYRPEPQVVEPLSPGMRIAFGILGFFTFPLAVGLFMLLFEALGVGLAGVVSVAVPLVIFASVYDKTRGSARTGLVTGIIITVVALAVGFGEMMLWLRAM